MSICTAPTYELKNLNNLFIELTSKNCNQRCKNCYIKFQGTKSVKDFISVDKIKECLRDSNEEPLKCIYLTGAEPMTHPDFNAILRLCLKRCDVCICTNGSTLNEKKIRFLKKVEDERSNNISNETSAELHHQIIFRLSLSHFSEALNDDVKYRGNFRQTIFVLKTLSSYNFNIVLNIQNNYKLSENEIIDNFSKIFELNNIFNAGIKITCSYPDYTDENFTKPSKSTDCMYGRILTATGIYTCPFLADDYRGRSGINLKNYSKYVNAETEFCATCSKNNETIFST